MPPNWWADARFWVALFVVGFWPAVLVAEIVGLAILLAVVVGGAYVTQRMTRSHTSGAA
jgi:steroid 5-alpha reductase family enzyme